MMNGVRGLYRNDPSYTQICLSQKEACWGFPMPLTIAICPEKSLDAAKGHYYNPAHAENVAKAKVSAQTLLGAASQKVKNGIGEFRQCHFII